MQEELKKGFDNLNEQLTQKLASFKGENEAELKEIKELSTKWQEEALKDGKLKQEQIDSLNVEIKKLKEQGIESPERQGIASWIEKQMTDAKEAEFKAYKENPHSGAFVMESKTIMTFSASTSGQVVDNVYVPGIVAPARRRMRVREIMPQGVTSGDKIPVNKQTATTNNAAITGEGSSKPQSDKTITLVEYPVRKIAHHFRVSDEMLDDMPGLSTFIAFQGVQDLMDVEDNQLLYGDGTGSNITGLTVQGDVLTAADVDADFVIGTGTQKWDCILAAAAALGSNEYEADMIMVNTSDWYNMLGEKGTDGHYIKNELVFENGQPYFRGIPVYRSTAITAGNVLVAEINKACQLFQRRGLTVEMFGQDQDNVVKNLQTIRIEERLALAIYNGDAVFYDSFDDIIAKIST